MEATAPPPIAAKKRRAAARAVCDRIPNATHTPCRTEHPLGGARAKNFEEIRFPTNLFGAWRVISCARAGPRASPRSLAYHRLHKL